MPTDRQQVATVVPQVPAPLKNTGALIQLACQESVAGFERAYTLTLFFATAALVLGCMLPARPRKWAGRRAADMPSTAH